MHDHWWLVVAFSSLARIFGECSTIHTTPMFVCFFLKWRLARAHEFQSLCKDQSTVAQQAEMTVAECSLTSCVWARFQIGSNTMSGEWHSQPIPTSLGQGVYVCFSVTCHLHFGQNDWGILQATAVTQGWNGHWVKVSTENWLWRREFSHCSCGTWTCNLSIKSLALYQQTIPAPPVYSLLKLTCRSLRTKGTAKYIWLS